MVEISIENNIDKNIDNKIAYEDSINNKQSQVQKSDLLNNELKPDDNAIDANVIDETKEIKYTKRKLYMFVGKTIFIFLDKYGNPLFIIGPQWPMIIFVVAIISIPMLLLYIFFWKYLPFITKLFGSINFWLAFLSYIYTSTINPGYPKNTIGRSFGIPRNDYYFCDYCRFYMRKTSFGSHCDLCDICIENYDHHCVWTGHCIGKNNKITFLVFVPSIFIFLFYIAFAFVQGLSRST